MKRVKNKGYNKFQHRYHSLKKELFLSFFFFETSPIIGDDYLFLPNRSWINAIEDELKLRIKTFIRGFFFFFSLKKVLNDFDDRPFSFWE